MNEITQTVSLHLPKSSRTPNGWSSFDCPVCQHLGHRPDNRKRGGFLETSTGGFKYNCFNCKFVTGWEPGGYIGKKCENLFYYLGIPKEVADNLKLDALKLIGENEEEELNSNSQKKRPTISDLPEKSVHVLTCIKEEKKINEDMLNVVEYLYHRNPNIFYWFDDIYWSEKYPNRAIFTRTSNGKVLGWTGRDCSGTMKNRYLDSLNNQHLFNMDKLFKNNRKFVIIVEGIMDAIAVDGVAICGSKVTENQLSFINKAKDDKEIILLPDRDKDGKALIKVAKDNGWSVSFPPWNDGIKDADDAVKDMGRLFALKAIIQNKESNGLKIDLKAKEWF